MGRISYTFKHECDCGNRPVLKDLGMCSVCTFGEASSMWEWLDDGVVKKERKLAEKYVFEDVFLQFDDLFDENDEMNPIVAMLLHIDQDVLDKIEERVLAGSEPQLAQSLPTIADTTKTLKHNERNE